MGSRFWKGTVNLFEQRYRMTTLNTPVWKWRGLLVKKMSVIGLYVTAAGEAYCDVVFDLGRHKYYCSGSRRSRWCSHDGAQFGGAPYRDTRGDD